MSPPPAPDVGPTPAARSTFVRALPWCVVVGGLVTLTPTAISPELLVAHLPTFLVLLRYAIAFARRAPDGESVSPIAIAAVVSGLVASVALMLIPIAAIREDPKSIGIYWLTWIVLPLFALVASGLAAVLAALCRLVFRPSSARGVVTPPRA